MDNTTEKKLCSAYVITDLLTSHECDLLVGQKKDSITPVRDPLARMGQEWVPQDDAYAWLYTKAKNALQKANEEQFGFTISSFETIQILRYQQLEYLDFHFDNFTPDTANRKLVISIQLNAQTEYFGGNLQIHTAEGLLTAPKEQGSAIIFPAYLPHKVTRVWWGQRHSLITRACSEAGLV